MIIAIVGGIGSGKTLTAVRWVIRNNLFAYTNIVLKNYPYWSRLKYSDIIKYEKNEKTGILKAVGVNWDYWNKKVLESKNFSVVIDELHNIAHSRQFMSAENRFIGQWVSQIRKILYDKKYNDLVIISQSPFKIDIDIRELCHIIISCETRNLRRGRLLVINKWFNGIEAFSANVHYMKTWFIGNQYFKFYDTLQIVQLEPTGYL